MPKNNDTPTHTKDTQIKWILFWSAFFTGLILGIVGWVLILANG